MSDANFTFCVDYERFVEAERALYLGEANNLVAFTLGQVGRYLRFLEIIYKRYKCAAYALSEKWEEYIELLNSGKELTDEDHQKFLMSWQDTESLHLEIESFFLFSNILLGKIGQCIERFFGQGQRCSLGSHRKLCKNIDSYMDQKDLVILDSWLEMADNLESSVTEYRDKSIAHFKNPRALYGTTFSKEGKAGILTTMLYPKESDTQSISQDVNEVYELIHRYCEGFQLVIKSNRGKSVFAKNAA